MKSLRGAFALGLLPTTAVAQSVVTVRLPTCIPGGVTGIPRVSILGGGTGIPGVGTGVLSGPAPTGLTTEVINVTATNSLGSVTVEPVTQVVTPGASATPSYGTTYNTPNGVYIQDYNFALPAGSSAPLNGASTSSGGMSVEYCGAYCGGSAYFALYNGDTCNCGGNSGGLAALPEGDTCTSCSGDAAECCGALREGTLFKVSSSGLSTSVFQYTTTNSLGSTVVQITTGTTTAPVQSTIPITFTTAITTTDSLGSSIVETSTGTSPATSPVEPATSVGATTPMASTTPGVPTTPVGSITPVAPTGPVESTSVGPSLVESTPSAPASVGPSSVGPSSVGPSVGVSSVAPSSAGPSPGSPSSVVPTTPVPPGTTTAPVVPSSTTPTTPTGTNLCPAPANSPYTDSNGRTYIVQCTADYPGNDLQASNQYTSLLGCMEYCDTLSGCIGVSFGAPYSCYPKYNITGIDYNYGNFDSAYVNTYQENAQTTTTFGVNPVASPTATTPATAAPPPPVATPTSAAPPPPVATPTSAAPPPTVTTPTTAPSSGPYSGPSCPASNGTNYETVFYNTYNITCGLELVGTNADEAMHADNEVDCLYACDLLVGCVGATWTGTADANATNCYPYYSVTSTQSDGAGSELFAGVNVNGPNNGTDTPDDYCDPAGANQTVITDLFGKSYFVGCGQQINSPGLLVEVTTTNMEACIEYCSISYSCVAVGYNGPHTAGFANTPNCFTFSENGVISQNLTINYALVQSS